jgi:choline-glycine betaine transporter
VLSSSTGVPKTLGVAMCAGACICLVTAGMTWLLDISVSDAYFASFVVCAAVHDACASASALLSRPFHLMLKLLLCCCCRVVLRRLWLPQLL